MNTGFAASRRRGFTLIELIGIMAIIAIIAVIAIPSLLSSRNAGNEADAEAYLRTLYSAQTTFQTKSGHFATIAELAASKLIAPSTIPAYTLTITVTPDGSAWAATATPTAQPQSMRFFYIDLEGVIHYKVGAAADSSSPPL